MSDKNYVGMTRCFYCGEYDRILLDTRLRRLLPMDCGIMDFDPCHACEEHMKQGIIFIEATAVSLDFEEQEQRKWENLHRGWTEEDYKRNNERPFYIPTPFRTGRFWVLKAEAIARMFEGAPWLEGVLKRRWTFIDEEAAHAMGLPTNTTDKEHGKGTETAQEAPVLCAQGNTNGPDPAAPLQGPAGDPPSETS